MVVLISHANKSTDISKGPLVECYTAKFRVNNNGRVSHFIRPVFDR
jgi:hypothetical protein